MDTTSSARVPPSATSLSESLVKRVNYEMDVLEALNSLYIFSHEFVHDGTSDSNARQDGRHSESQSPISRECQDEASNKCSKEADYDGNLFRYTLMDQV